MFAGGYLRGHLTLAVAELEGEGEHSAEAVNSKVSQSLEKAISAGELSPPDQILVQGDVAPTCINRRKIRPEPCCSPGQASAVPGNCLPSWFYFTAFPFSSFLTHSRFGFSAARYRYPAAAVHRSSAPPAAQRLTARCKSPRGSERPKHKQVVTDRRATGVIPAVRGGWRIASMLPHSLARCRPLAGDRGWRSARRSGRHWR